MILVGMGIKKDGNGAGVSSYCMITWEGILSLVFWLHETRPEPSSYFMNISCEYEGISEADDDIYRCALMPSASRRFQPIPFTAPLRCRTVICIASLCMKRT